MNDSASTSQATAAPATLPLRQRLEAATGALWRALGLARDAVLTPFYLAYERHLSAQAAAWRIPQHIGIIMDGNRRFARNQHLLHVTDGHIRGADKLEEVLNWCEEVGVRVVTVWSFSLDNFNRDPAEVHMLMELFQRSFWSW